jgi:glycosyltransferase involved in cell wall biosynthesis
LVVLEAMACGTPAIMSNVGYGSELAVRFPEFVVDTPYEVMAVEMVRRLKLINQHQAEFSCRARQFVTENHSIKVYSEQWDKLIRSL